MGVQKIVYSPANLRTITNPLELLVPTIYFGMPPIPVLKGVSHANSIGLRGVSRGGATITTQPASPASTQGSGAGSVKGIAFPKESGNSTKRIRRSGKRRNIGNIQTAAPRTNKAKKKARGKILGRNGNGQFKKKGA